MFDFNFNFNINKSEAKTLVQDKNIPEKTENKGLFKNIGSVFDIILPPTMRLGLSTEDVIEKIKEKNKSN